MVNTKKVASPVLREKLREVQGVCEFGGEAVSRRVVKEAVVYLGQKLALVKG